VCCEGGGGWVAVWRCGACGRWESMNIGIWLSDSDSDKDSDSDGDSDRDRDRQMQGAKGR
jgi:hypothetical protein